MSEDDFIERKVSERGLLTDRVSIGESVAQTLRERQAAGLLEGTSVRGGDGRRTNQAGGSFIRNDGSGTYRTINENVEAALNNTDGLLKGINDIRNSMSQVSEAKDEVAKVIRDSSGRILSGQTSMREEVRGARESLFSGVNRITRDQELLRNTINDAGRRVVTGQSSIRDEIKTGMIDIMDDNAGLRRTARDGFDRIAGVVRAVGGDIGEVANILDTNADKRVSDLEIRQAARDNSILLELQKINPLIARSIRDPNFRIRTIKKETVRTGTIKTPSNQKNLVKQGYAGYLQDLNEFNVDF
tara:strand:+ start:5410 stop:6312 length:903 start_codon:yes stop_codon:yes gene_type:complete